MRAVAIGIECWAWRPTAGPEQGRDSGGDGDFATYWATYWAAGGLVRFTNGEALAAMRFRPFLNSDPPAIAEIWHSHPPTRGLLQSTTPAVLEQAVFAKPYFDRQGLILAVDDQRPIGFVHAGFGADQRLARCSRERGATCMLMVGPHDRREDVADELLARSEEYLRGGGATVLYGGGVFPVNPFYLGLYGGSELSGVLTSDQSMIDLYRRSGYGEVERRVVLQCRLTGFRPIIDRRQMQTRRRYHVQTTVDPPTSNWWEACTLGDAERTRFSVCPRGGGECGSVTVWDMEPLAASWGVHAAGLIQLEIAEPLRRQGLATFLAGEALRQLQTQGVSVAEVHLSREDAIALRLYAKLGFEQVDEAIVFRKDA